MPKSKKKSMKKSFKRSPKRSQKKNSSPAKKAKTGGGKHRVYVAFVSKPDKDELTEFIGNSGKPLSIKWLNHRNGQFRGAGFVDFATVKEANSFVKKNQSNYQGKQIQIKHADTPTTWAGITGVTQMYVANVPTDDEDAFRKFIGDCSHVNKIWFMTDDDDEFKNCGFVEFSKSEFADTFKQQKDGKKLGGKRIKINYGSNSAPTIFMTGFGNTKVPDGKLKKFLGIGFEEAKWVNNNAFVFVTFSTIAEMNKVIKNKHNAVYQGNKITVRRPQKKRLQRKQ